jgi:hypothetical protein
VDIDLYTLHRARVTAGLSLEELARRTRISPGLLKLIDDGRFERLPGGIYARSYVRTVAQILSVDPDEAVRALTPLMRDGELGLHHAGDTVSSQGAQASIGEQAHAPVPPAHARAVPQAFTPWQLRDEDWRRWGASMIDGAAVAAIWLALWAVARAAVGDASLHPGVSVAAVSIAASLVAAVYFIVFAGIGGSTPGDLAMRVSPGATDSPMQPQSIGRQAAGAFLMKSSVLVDLLYTTEWALEALRIKNAE